MKRAVEVLIAIVGIEPASQVGSRRRCSRAGHRRDIVSEVNNIMHGMGVRYILSLTLRNLVSKLYLPTS